MSTVKISQLSATSSLNSSDVLPVVDSGTNPGSPTTYKITVKNLADSLTQVSSSISASYAISASIASTVSGSVFTSNNLALSASYAITASYALNGGGSSTPGGSTNQLQYNNGGAFGGVSTAIFDGTNLRVTGSFSGSLVGQLTGTSSWALNAVTSSFVTLAQSASFVTLAQTASFVTLAQTASFVTLAQTASFVRNLNQDLIITGSLIVSGSPSPEIRVMGEMTITGSLVISGSSALRVFNSASIVSGSLAVGNITPSSTVGRIDASNDVVAFSTSDERLKTDISNITDPITKINMINGVNFTWLENPEVHGNSGRDVGVIAQEIQKVLPEVVTTRDNGYKAVKYEKIVPLLIEAIKDLQKQINELKANK